MSDNSLYFLQQDLQHHARHPLNFGLKPNLSFVSGQHNPSCGDSVTIGGIICQGIVTDLCFQGSGCVISMAMASKLTEACKGMSIDQIKALDDAFVFQLLKINLGINRLPCGMLAIGALQKALASFVAD